jgi:TonB family protein
VEPKYTRAARKKHLEEIVVLCGIIDAEGVPQNLEVAKGIDPGLNAEAIKAVYEWRFNPAEKAGVPVAVEFRVEVKFWLCCKW